MQQQQQQQQWSAETAVELFRTLHAAHRPDRPTRFDDFVEAESVARALASFQERHPSLTPVVAKRKLQDALRSASFQARAQPAWCMPGTRPERKDHKWADLSNLALWAALIEGKSGAAGAKRARTAAGDGEEQVASSLASLAQPTAGAKLVAKFDGMGDFSALATFEQLTPDTIQLSVPVPTSVTPKCEALVDAETNEMRVWIGNALASVRLPRGVFPRRASVKTEASGPLLSMWRVRVQLAPFVPIELRLEI